MDFSDAVIRYFDIVMVKNRHAEITGEMCRTKRENEHVMKSTVFT